MKSFIEGILGIFALALVSVSCSKDDEPAKFQGSYTCVISSCVIDKDLNSFISDSAAVQVLEINDSTAKIVLPSFTAKLYLMPTAITIGPMTIDNVSVTHPGEKAPWEQNILFVKEKFNCQAGQYNLYVYNLEGTLINGKFVASITYRLPENEDWAIATSFVSHYDL